MKAILTRDYQKWQTPGVFKAYDTEPYSNILVLKIFTLELPWENNQPIISCIPAGIYNVVKIIRPSGKVAFQIMNVPGRTNILFHPGNFAAGDNPDIEGCILPGFKYADINADGFEDITESTKAMNLLLKIMPDKFKLQII